MQDAFERWCRGMLTLRFEVTVFIPRSVLAQIVNNPIGPGGSEEGSCVACNVCYQDTCYEAYFRRYHS